MNGGRLEVIDDLHAGTGRQGPPMDFPFLTSFSDVDMRVVHVLSEGDRAAARFSCSGTHTGIWQMSPRR
jgi:hypothetical protein